jgi:hypothetical protein
MLIETGSPSGMATAVGVVVAAAGAAPAGQSLAASEKRAPIAPSHIAASAGVAAAKTVAAVAPHAHRFVIDAAPNSVSPCIPEHGSEATKRIANRGSCDIGRIVRLTIHAEQILHMKVSYFDLSRPKNASSCATRQNVSTAG